MCSKNSFNGLLYKNEPTILGWGLFNEMRCPANQMTPVSADQAAHHAFQFSASMGFCKSKLPIQPSTAIYTRFANCRACACIVVQ